MVIFSKVRLGVSPDANALAAYSFGRDLPKCRFNFSDLDNTYLPTL